MEMLTCATIILLALIGGHYGPGIINAWSQHQQKMRRLKLLESQEQRKMLAAPLEQPLPRKDDDVDEHSKHSEQRSERDEVRVRKGQRDR